MLRTTHRLCFNLWGWDHHHHILELFTQHNHLSLPVIEQPCSPCCGLSVSLSQRETMVGAKIKKSKSYGKLCVNNYSSMIHGQAHIDFRQLEKMNTADCCQGSIDSLFLFHKVLFFKITYRIRLTYLPTNHHHIKFVSCQKHSTK